MATTQTLPATLTPADAAAEILRRKRCQTSLPSFVMNVDLPGAPMDALCPDEDLVGPARDLLTDHHAVLCDALEETMNTPFGRLMVFMPPGAAKSTYCNAAMAWDMGRPQPPFRQGDTRLIHISYNDTIVKKQSRRVKTICASAKYRTLFDDEPRILSDAAAEWSMSNGAEYMAAGIMAGVTGNRADGVLIDDPVKNREDADSEQIRQKTLDEYQDSVMSRLKPGAYVIIVQTRWSELDLAGSILPDDYDGRSGIVRCKDGMDWRIINIPAKAERADDPLGRQIGEYLWPEWFPPRHWAQYENDDSREGRRRWSSLYQQRPTPEGSGDFSREDFNWYTPGEEPMNLHLYGASDYAVTEKGGDFSEHGVAGLDGDNNLWFVDWWSGQTTTDESIDAFLDLVIKHSGNLRLWANEGGVIDKAVRPAINRRMRERNAFVDLRSLPSMKDKVAKVSSFGARASAKCVWLPKVRWAYELVDQLVALPAGRYDDKADVAGLIGRMIDKFLDAAPPPEKRPRGIKPFTGKWLEYEEPSQSADVCYR